MPLPKTYKAAVVTELNAPFKIQERTLEEPKDGEILIKLLACGLCRSDSFTVNGALGSELPKVPGHEIVGEIVAVPSSETKWKVGDWVGSGWHGGQCGVCKACKKGWFFQCEQDISNGGKRDGGYAEYCYLRTEAAARVPKGVDAVQVAAQLCAGVTVFNGMRRVPGVKKGDLVAIQGIGGLGHLGIQFAKALGYEVAALSSTNSKEKLSKELGATHYFSGTSAEQAKKLQDLGGATLIVATAPEGATFSDLIYGLHPFGTLLLLGVPFVPIPFDPIRTLQWNLTIKGHSAGVAQDCEDTIEFAVKHNVRTLVETYSLDQAQQAYDDMYAGKPRLRAVFKF